MTRSTASLPCRSGSHNLCALRWKNRQQECVCNCDYHNQPQLAGNPPDVMEFIHAFRRIFLDSLPPPLQADWDPEYGPRLAGFPVHVLYRPARRTQVGSGDVLFDPRTFSQDSEVRRMQYYAKRESRFWFEVVICKPMGRCGPFAPESDGTTLNVPVSNTSQGCSRPRSQEARRSLSPDRSNDHR